MKVVFNPQGFYDVRRSAGVVAELDKIAQKTADWCNANGKGTFAVGSQQGRKAPQGRWRASVVTADATAIAHNAKHHDLLRGVSAAGGSS